MESSWYRYKNGETIGQRGSEQGIIVHDEEHPLGARITLERNTSIAPFTITCGIYECLVHTRFFALENEASAEYGSMKDALSVLLETVNKTCTSDEEGRKLRREFYDAVDEFVRIYP